MAKIADFGLTRDVTASTSEQYIPGKHASQIHYISSVFQQCMCVFEETLLSYTGSVMSCMILEAKRGQCVVTSSTSFSHLTRVGEIFIDVTALCEA